MSGTEGAQGEVAGNGAQVLISSLVELGVDTCFMNPGTSEMHFVAALDAVPEMKGVLALFEGVATGAADGYARVAEKPAATLLHLGPGLGNGLANLHNAKRAFSPVVNIVGDHATYHQKFDAPLASDIMSLANPMSGWVKETNSVEDVRRDIEEAVRAAWGPPAKVATLIVPADVSWLEAPLSNRKKLSTAGFGAASAPNVDSVSAAAKALRSGRPGALLVGGRATDAKALELAGRIANATGSKLLCETFPANLRRGAGIVAPERLAYLAELATMQLQGIEHLVVVDTRPPVSFFAYPGKPSDLVPLGCEVHLLATGTEDVFAALTALAEETGAANADPSYQESVIPPQPTGQLDGNSIAASIASLLPEGAIISDESNTAGLSLGGATAGAPPHELLTLTGGAIGQGMPVATGAAVGAPGRKVLSLEADGSAMYTLQSLWTQAREGLDVTTVIFNNQSYAVLQFELGRVGAGKPGPLASSMLDIDNPNLDFVSLAKGMGVPAARAITAEQFTELLAAAISEEGPSLVEAVLKPGL